MLRTRGIHFKVAVIHIKVATVQWFYVFEEDEISKHVGSVIFLRSWNW